MQTKQIRFLHQTAVKFEKLYVFRADDWSSLRDASVEAAQVVLRFQNKAANGLGLALPAGNVSMRQPQAIAGGREVFIGEHGVRDVPQNEEFELPVGATPDVEVQGRVVSDDSKGGRERTRLAFTLTNAKPAPVSFELRQRPDGQNFRVLTESAPHVLKNGDDVWRVTIPAGGTAALGYTFETR